MMIFVKPMPGKRIRHPEKMSYVLPAEGCQVEYSIHWKRYIKAGDVEVVEGAQEATDAVSVKSKKGAN